MRGLTQEGMKWFVMIIIVLLTLALAIIIPGKFIAMQDAFLNLWK